MKKAVLSQSRFTMLHCSRKRGLTFFVLALILFSSVRLRAQELFVFTDPASTLPARSIAVRLTNWYINDPLTHQTDVDLMPQVLIGVSKKIRIDVQGYISNRSRPFSPEGGSLYGQYRFYTKDGVYRHFRMALFGRISTNNGNVYHQEIQTDGHNAGYHLGFIATQLLHKYALSASTSFEHAFDNGKGNVLPSTYGRNAVDYTLSFGHLLFPREYKSYRQVNLNAMVELLGQTLLKQDKSILDIAPALQLIINSQTRIDVGYKKQLYSGVLRFASDGLLLRVEHTFFR